MNRKTGVLLAAILISSFCLGLAQAAEKFAYVDLSRAFSEYNKTKDYDKVLTDKEGVYTAERDKKVSEVKQFQDKYNLLSEKEKQSKQGDLDTKVKTLQDYDRQKQADLRKDQDEKMKEILKDIDEAVKKYSEKEGFTMVFNDRVLVYQEKRLDITDKILDILNKGYKK
ncbi:MAG: OmpH family outer membrane protein [Candidatus Omnitrophica bacterium]|nr:OmpH family outer membrane protein [Candidatus Omnitrophota bacterium]